MTIEALPNPDVMTRGAVRPARVYRIAGLAVLLAAASALLARMSADDTHLLDRMGLESRIREIKTELESLEGQVGKTGEAILFFYGVP